jgi:1,4-dihydroxy-2-naphthoate octaprenyltransferase
MAKLLRLARPQFLISSLPIYILGAFWAILLGASSSFPRLLIGYLIILLAQLSISFSNDYFDIEVDKLGTPTLFSGGSRILVENPALRKSALWIALALNVCSVIVGVLFQQHYSYPIWFLGIVVAINIIGWLYSAPPIKLAYRGFGELLTALSIGFFVPVIGYLVARGYLNDEGRLFTIPLVLYALVTILLVELPDMEADRLGQKKTWVAQKGRRFGFTAIGLLLFIATGCQILVPFIYQLPQHFNFRLLEFLSLLPLGAGILGMIKRPTDRKKAIGLMNMIIGAMAAFFVLTDIVLIIAAT